MILIPLSVLERAMRRPLTRAEWRGLFAGPTLARPIPRLPAANGPHPEAP